MAILFLLLSVFLIIVLTVRFELHPFFALLGVAIFYGFCVQMPLPEIISSINTGFGDTLGKIGLLIIIGVVIGAFLENSGGAYALAEKVIRLIGKNRIPTAMGILGYFISIPVFADSGFILLAPLNKSLSKKAGGTLAGSAIALALGLMASHTMVPPTPGPIAAAGILNADLGLVLALGIPVSALALLPGLLFANKYVAKTYIDPNPDLDEATLKARLVDAPGAFKSTLPIVIPIFLIILKSLTVTFGIENASLLQIINFVGEPLIALLIGLLLALLLPKKLERHMLSVSGWTGKALRDATSIILITGAGGIFGRILQNSGIADLLGEVLGPVNLGLFLPFLLSAAIKTAQGSSTVALITAASIMMPLMATLGFDTELEKAMVVITIGAGSAVVAHANDSFFWVVTQMSGMDVKTGYRLFTLGTLVLGTSAFLIVFLLNLILA